MLVVVLWSPSPSTLVATLARANCHAHGTLLSVADGRASVAVGLAEDDGPAVWGVVEWVVITWCCCCNSSWCGAVCATTPVKETNKIQVKETLGIKSAPSSKYTGTGF